MRKSVAIVGYSIRFPASDNKTIWKQLVSKKDLVGEVADGRWSKEAYFHPGSDVPGSSYSFSAGSLGDISGFDATFFGISPREAVQIDPQQRMLLELAWESLENSGIVPSTLARSNCGVYLGISSMDYASRLTDDEAGIDQNSATGGTLSIAANRISYTFDLRGPSLAIDTACSSSLVAFHQACQAIRVGECSMALAGGISLHLHPYSFIVFSKANMLSRQGRCRVFDSSGDGYVRSEGGGIFVLKDYEKALADGDPILAVVAATGVNTDGHKSGLTVPNPEAQSALLTDVYAQAGISPESIDYIEAHGTGTPVGDPIETRAIGLAIGQRRPTGSPIPIGSVKSNLGHLEPASGVAGLAKAILSLQHRMVPATIGVEQINPRILCDEWNIAPVTEHLPLKADGTLTIGVNSFGFGGANAHVVLQTPPQQENESATISKSLPLPILINGKDQAACQSVAGELAKFLREETAATLYDVAYTTLFRREHMRHRAAFLATDVDDAVTRLQQYAELGDSAPDVVTERAQQQQNGSLAFVYSGNGSQWAGMGQALLENHSFRAAVEEVDALFQPLAGFSLMDELSNKENHYDSTAIAQPALFALQVGITRMLAMQGVSPSAVTGHSVGEVAAAWACGALSLPDAVRVIFERSRLQETTRGNGQMTAVALGEAELQALMDEMQSGSSLVLAGNNSPAGTTVAGDVRQLERLEASLTQRNVRFKRLALDYAFHSPAMDVIEKDVQQALEDIRPQTGTIPFYSTVTGERLDSKYLGATYWWENIRQPVRFAEAIDSLLDEQYSLFVEIGPHSVLRGYVTELLRARSVEGKVITTGSKNNLFPKSIERTLCQILIHGGHIDWSQLFPVAGRFAQLPTYPWQKESYWRKSSSESTGMLERYPVHPLLGWPIAQQPLSWENKIDIRLHPMLADHVVGDSILFPGSGFLELALAAAAQYQPDNSWLELEGLEIRRPLILDGAQPHLVRFNLEESDSRFTIKARDYGQHSPWTVHATGRILPEPLGLRANVLPRLLIPARKPDFDATEHTALTLRTSLAYGPAFQCLARGWFEDDASVLGQLIIPEAITARITDYFLHPALLDCTFQLLLQLLRDELMLVSEGVFVPVSTGRISCLHSDRIPAYGRATLIGRTAHSLSANFVVYSDNGDVIAYIEQVRLRRVRLKNANLSNLSYLRNALVPVPLPGTRHATTPPISFVEINQGIADLAQHFSEVGLLQTFVTEVDPLLDGLCARFAATALRRHVKIVPTNDHISRLIEMVEEDGLDQGHEPDSISAAELWRGLIAEYPSYSSLIHAVGRVGLRLPEYFAAPQQRRTIFNWQPSLCDLLKHTISPDAKSELNNSVQDLVAQCQKELEAGSYFKLVEISDGESVIASELLATFNFLRGELQFVSTSIGGVEKTEYLKEKAPLFIVEQLNEEATFTTPDKKASLVVIAMNFTRQQDAERALRYAKTQLANDGVLLLIGYPLSRWMDFVFGATQEDWFDQRALFQHTQLHDWLCDEGFSDVTLHNLSEQIHSSPYLLVARNSTDIEDVPQEHQPGNHWLIYGDTDCAQAVDLKGNLEQQGHHVSTLDVSLENHRLGGALDQTSRQFGRIDGIIVIFKHDDQLPEPDSILTRQLRQCTALTLLSQACAQIELRAHCWLITHGAMSDSANNHDAALWGFARTLANENSLLSLYLVDLDNRLDSKQAAAALSREILQQDREVEVVLGANGERFATRLIVQPDPSSIAETAQDDDMPIRQLGFVFPGKLDNLEWFVRERVDLKDHEIEVAVHSSGLNFRDVMFALGLLPDEAIETGFAGPTLGLEFAGEIVRIGGKVTEFAIGDKVVGFGPSSFANYVITSATSIARIPENLAYESAASIPTAFFTVYYALHYLARLQPGEKVLIHGAAGAVGIAAIQIAQWIGAEIHATVGSDEKRDFLRLMGIEHIYNSRSLAFADEVLAATGGNGVDVVLNSLAGEALLRNFQVLRPFGRFLELGKRDFYENSRIGLRPFRNNISYFGIDADQMMIERPELAQQIFTSVIKLLEEGVITPLPLTVFDASDIVSAFRHMQQARQIGKIVITYQNGIPRESRSSRKTSKSIRFAESGTWLVTGGLRGFGLKSAQWLCDKGVRNIVLLGRSDKLSDETQQAIDELKSKGINLLIRVCDVTNESALTALLQEISTELPPLKGIIHAAAVFEDGLVCNLEQTKIERVLAPKILGAELLHRLTLEMQLEHFILYSSATTLFGNPGQSSYVAANMWLEAFARRRRSSGLPATVVLWGGIDDVGFLARNEQIKEALQSRLGGSSMKSDTALDVLGKMKLSDCSEIGVMDLEWRSLSRFLPTSQTPRYHELHCRFGSGDSNHDDSVNLELLLTQLSDIELKAHIAYMLSEEVSTILRLSVERIDLDQPLTDMGLDSLMGVELAVALEVRFGFRLPAMALQDRITINKLALRIIELLRGNAEQSAKPSQVELVAKRIDSELLTNDALTSVSASVIGQSGRSLTEND